MAKAAESIDATLVVLYMGRLDGLPQDDLSLGWRPLPAGLREGLPAGVVFVDTTERVAAHYAKQPKRRLFVHQADGHPNGLAHALFARMLRQQILAHRLLPAAPATVAKGT
jgi:hypothetical protein